MTLRSQKRHWWYEPDLKPRAAQVRVSNYRRRKGDPTEADLPVVRQGRVATFKPPIKWVYYNRLQGLDVGYLTRVYSLREIGQRYGLSHNGMIYFRKHILPEPFDIVRRRSVHAHHWSRFVMLALDVVLTDLHERGYNQFLKSYTDHVDLLHRGVEYMEAHYADKYEREAYDQSDEFGVVWFND